jgi:hypothetical protein
VLFKDLVKIMVDHDLELAKHELAVSKIARPNARG